MMDPSCCIVLYFVKVVCIFCCVWVQMADAYSSCVGLFKLRPVSF